MSESESDQDLNVSQYGVEDDLNAYGSPTYRAQEAAVCRTNVSINSLPFNSFLVVCFMINSLVEYVFRRFID
jgi:hypothetical protein